MTLAIDVENTEQRFRFRIRNTKTGKTTDWASYTGQCYMDGMATATQYMLPEQKALTLLPADEFLRLTSTL